MPKPPSKPTRPPQRPDQTTARRRLEETANRRLEELRRARARIRREERRRLESVQQSGAAEKEEEDLDRQERKERIRHLEQERELRKEYSDRLFELVCWWLVAVLAVVFLQGMSGGRFQLATWTMNILVGSTTVSIVSLVAIVATSLFPRDGIKLFSRRGK